ncbi:phosphoribosylaminoimidazole carboxylase [Salinibacter altiplanensis]|uniref:phosphoribosylaminoimidazole carboxylase n=1 Tax=Salinibacter altiplanensis TaxID=1803181 RepID=UPI000C9EE32B|nr:phosphoribosylaminoimidazole carboxylase [Salinibacter altiplanensis]
MSDTDRSPTILHPASGGLILGLDWLLFSENAITLGLSTLFVAAVGAGVVGLGVGVLQHRYGADGPGLAGLKGLLGGIAVGIPLPVAGTALGGSLLAISGLDAFWPPPFGTFPSAHEDER